MLKESIPITDVPTLENVTKEKEKTLVLFTVLCYDKLATQIKYSTKIGNVFYFGKNAFSALHSLFEVEDLCSNKWSYAFFGVWLRLELHTFLF